MGKPVRVSSPQGRFAAEAADLDGEVLVGAESAGKHLFLEFPVERFIHIHLGLIGKFDDRRHASAAACRPGAASSQQPHGVRRSAWCDPV